MTTPTRTLADLCSVDDIAHRAAAEEFARRAPGLAARTHAWLSGQGKLPHKRRALALLADLATRAPGQEDVTR